MREPAAKQREPAECGLQRAPRDSPSWFVDERQREQDQRQKDEERSSDLQILSPAASFQLQIEPHRQIYKSAPQDVDVSREKHHPLATFERPDGRLVQAHGLSAEHERQDAEQSCDEVKLAHGFEESCDLAEEGQDDILPALR